jgi:hypothetical protein
MREFSSFTNLEKVKIVIQGREWMRKHEAHVKMLLETSEPEYAPSGSDCFHPELWKPGHWRWFRRSQMIVQRTENGTRKI